jgi:uncharacterized repeat protein (TIGR03803 family)
VFELVKGSNTITTLASFDGTDGANPVSGVIADSSGNLYGTTLFGGPSDLGTVFELARSTGRLTALASFNGTNGRRPYDNLVMDSSGNLYGSAWRGGAHQVGAVFEVTAASSVAGRQTGTAGAPPAGPTALPASTAGVSDLPADVAPVLPSAGAGLGSDGTRANSGTAARALAATKDRAPGSGTSGGRSWFTPPVIVAPGADNDS